MPPAATSAPGGNTCPKCEGLYRDGVAFAERELPHLALGLVRVDDAVLVRPERGARLEELPESVAGLVVFKLLADGEQERFSRRALVVDTLQHVVEGRDVIFLGAFALLA